MRRLEGRKRRGEQICGVKSIKPPIRIWLIYKKIDSCASPLLPLRLKYDDPCDKEDRFYEEANRAEEQI